MHKYMRAIGFSKDLDIKQIKKLIKEVEQTADAWNSTQSDNNVTVGEYRKVYGRVEDDEVGIAVCGEIDEAGDFESEYYFPYFKGTGITTYEDVSVERHSSKLSYAGVCDDIKVGVALIFYLQNMIPYENIRFNDRLPIQGTSVTLSALSIDGMILLPVKKNNPDSNEDESIESKRKTLLEKAKEGDEEAIQTLTFEDIDRYAEISKRIYKEDLYSIVDSSFMPYGVECDQYSVLGEIIDIKKIKNHFTKEELCILTIETNDLTFDVCINIIDLVGEPKVGRRFKGNIWLQGNINFPQNQF